MSPTDRQESTPPVNPHSQYYAVDGHPELNLTVKSRQAEIFSEQSVMANVEFESKGRGIFVHLDLLPPVHVGHSIGISIEK